MLAVKGIYHDGIVELIKEIKSDETSEVLVIFSEGRKKINKIGGLFKEHKIKYKRVEEDLSKLNKESSRHMLDELKD